MTTINKAIIHKLIKEKHGTATVIERTTPLSITEPVRKLVTDIHDLYASRASKGYGRFEADTVNYPSSVILKSFYQDGSTSFEEASKQLMSVLVAKSSPVALATGGYVLMAQVSNDAGVNWFIVAIINNVKGSAIDEASLEVIDTVHVNLNDLRVAGRVNLNDWLSEDLEIRYVGFLKQKGEVADYFKMFLGCNELIADTEESKKLVKFLKTFAKEQSLDQDKEEEFLRSAFDYLETCNSNDVPLSLETLSNAIWPENPETIINRLATEEIQISDGFVPDLRSIKSLVKIKSKTQYWSLNLDRHAFATGFAHYDSANGQLILKNLPDSLKSELSHELGDGN